MLLYSYIHSYLGTCPMFWQMRAFEGNPPNSIEPRTTHTTLEHWGQLNAHLLVKQTHFLGKWNTVEVGRCQASIWCWSNCKPSCRCVSSIVMLWRLELLLAYGSNSQGVSDAGIIGKLVFWLWVSCCLLLTLIIISASVVPIIHTAESNAYTHTELNQAQAQIFKLVVFQIMLRRPTVVLVVGATSIP